MKVSREVQVPSKQDPRGTYGFRFVEIQSLNQET